MPKRERNSNSNDVTSNLTLKQRKRAKQTMDITPLSTPAPITTTTAAPGTTTITKYRYSYTEHREEGLQLRQINVVEFAESRSHEINSLEKALKNATEHAGMQRVFQRIPRHMRRRAASHNVKRLPQKYRQKAIEQMERDPTPPNTAKKSTRRQKRRAGSIREHFAKRQIEKKWLETHVWHAKRMKMVEMWGYKLALQPNDKSIKSLYRAGNYECVLHDASYYECVELSGSQEIILELLKGVVDPFVNVGSDRFLSGSRMGKTFVYELNTFPFKMIAPVEFIWQKCVDGVHKLWLWVHPSATAAVHCVLNESKDSLMRIDLDSMTIELIESQMCRFELTGPRSHAILDEILDIDPTDPNFQSWQTLHHLQSSASLPPGAIISLNIQDPRLNPMPRMPVRVKLIEKADLEALNALLVNWNTAVSTQSKLWDNKALKTLESKTRSNKEIEARKRKLLLPGTKLPFESEDVSVPMMLVQRNTLSETGHSKTAREFLGGYSVFLPKKWSNVFWMRLVFGGARVCGLREMKSMFFEAGLPAFPYDFVGTGSYKFFKDGEVKENEAGYFGKPKGKRILYKEGVEPFESPFWSVSGMKLESMFGMKIKGTKEADEKKIKEMKEEWDKRYEAVHLLKSSKILDHVWDGIVSARKEGIQVEDNVCKALVEFLENAFGDRVKLEDLLKIFVQVLLEPLGGEVIEPHAVVSTVKKSNLETKEDTRDESVDELTDETLIGYVTSGRYSFSEGHGKAIGCLQLGRLLKSIDASMKIAQNGTGKNMDKWVVMVKNPNGKRDIKCRIKWLGGKNVYFDEICDYKSG